MNICFILGTRPEIIKLSPLIKLCKKRKLKYTVIHTGQHFEYNMEGQFFKDLSVKPNYFLNLNTKKNYNKNFMDKAVSRLVEYYQKLDPDYIVNQGDTNTVLASALAYKKIQNKIKAKLVHVEAGIRSFDKKMPEEINRIKADKISDILLAPTKIAKKNDADIFISLHADYNRNKNARGISLYTLSERASDKEAAALARRENRSDLIGGVDLTTESSEVTSILLDLTKRDTLNQSSHLVKFLIKSFKNEMNLLQRTHRSAGFAVLKSLDIPSVLIEMGYLSNKNDSKLLITESYQKKLSDKIVKAVINYFDWKDKNNG